jgi:hypothetical protein
MTSPNKCQLSPLPASGTGSARDRTAARILELAGLLTLISVHDVQQPHACWHSACHSIGTVPCADAQTGSADLPPDVTGFISRRVGCAEWSHKAIDPEHKAQMDDVRSIMVSLKCDDVADDERALRQKYASNPAILASLDAVWVKVVKRLPVQIAIPPALDR